MAKKRKAKKTAKKRATSSASRKKAAGARSAPKRSTKPRKKRVRGMTEDQALHRIYAKLGTD